MGLSFPKIALKVVKGHRDRLQLVASIGVVGAGRRWRACQLPHYTARCASGVNNHEMWGLAA